ncbi:MAG: hypothetical protein ACOH5I_13480 [Oligoflexus sp.]
MFALIKDYLQKLSKSEASVFLVGLSLGVGLGYWQFAHPHQNLQSHVANLLKSQEKVQDCQNKQEVSLQQQVQDLQQAKQRLFAKEAQIAALELRQQSTLAALTQTRETIRDISKNTDPTDCIHQHLPNSLRHQ